VLELGFGMGISAGLSSSMIFKNILLLRLMPLYEKARVFAQSAHTL
jgi:hypothetical protein